MCAVAAEPKAARDDNFRREESLGEPEALLGLKGVRVQGQQAVLSSAMQPNNNCVPSSRVLPQALSSLVCAVPAALVWLGCAACC